MRVSRLWIFAMVTFATTGSALADPLDIIQSFPVTNAPAANHIGNDGTDFWIANWTTNYLTVLSGTDGHFISHFSMQARHGRGYDESTGVLWSESELWHADGLGYLYRLNTSNGTFAEQYALGTDNPQGVVMVDSTHFIYGDNATDRYYKITLDRQNQTVVNSVQYASPFDNPNGLALHNGRLFATFDNGAAPGLYELDQNSFAILNHWTTVVADQNPRVITWRGNELWGLAIDSGTLSIARFAGGPVPRLTIAAPFPGQNVYKACTLRIQWSAVNTPAPAWQFFLNTGPNQQLLRQVSPTPIDDGNGNWHADWTVPTDLVEGFDYDLDIKDNTSGVDAHAGFFSVSCRGVQTVQPMAHQAAQKGCSLAITWSTQGCQAPDWKFFLDKNDVFQQQITPTAVDDGGGNWHAVWSVPPNLVNGVDYSIVVKDDSCGGDSHSPQFAILDTIRLGDLNGDGQIDGNDVQSLVNALLGN